MKFAVTDHGAVLLGPPLAARLQVLSYISATCIGTNGQHAARVTQRVVIAVLEEQPVGLSDILIDADIELVVALRACGVKDEVVSG